MKKLSLLILVLLACVSARAASFIVTATVTITNTPVVTNSFVYNSDTRTWQTTNSSTQIQATNSIAKSVTNLYQHLVTYPLVGPVSVRITTSSNLTFVSPTGTNVSITFGGSGWGRVSYVTNAVATGLTVTVPDANVTNRPTATNIASGLIDWLKYASNTMSATAPTFTNFLSIAPNGRTFTNVIFSTPAITGGGITNSAITNAPSISGSNIAFVTGTLTNVTERMSTNVNPVIQGAREISGIIGSVTNGNAYGTTITNSPAIQVTNLIARGGTLSNFIGHTITITNLDAPGSGNNSQRIGLNSISGPGEGTIALGTSAEATNTYGIAIGTTAWAYGLNAVAVGGGSSASGYYSLVFGAGESTASGSKSIVIGQDSTAAYTNSVAFGSYVTTLEQGEFRIGNSSNYFSLGGPIMGLVSSNALLKGYSTNSSSWTETSTVISSLANGHNIMSISDSASFFTLSGPSAAWYLDAITNRWTDRVITLLNQSGQTMILANESGFTSTADTRLANQTAADFPVATNMTVVLKYLNSRWTVIGGSAVGNTNLYQTVADYNVAFTNVLTNVFNLSVSNATQQQLFRDIASTGPTNSHVAQFRTIEQGTNMVIYSTGTSVVFNATSSQTNTVITTNSTFSGALSNGFTLDFKTNFTATLAAGNISIGLREFVSTNITCGFSTSIQMAHGLPVVPTRVRAVLRNIVAERGWVIGDEVPITAIWYTGYSRPWGTVWANSTNVGVSVNNAPASSVEWVDKTGSLSTTTFTNVANWRMVIYARP